MVMILVDCKNAQENISPRNHYLYQFGPQPDRHSCLHHQDYNIYQLHVVLRKIFMAFFITKITIFSCTWFLRTTCSWLILVMRTTIKVSLRTSCSWYSDLGDEGSLKVCLKTSCSWYCQLGAEDSHKGLSEDLVQRIRSSLAPASHCIILSATLGLQGHCTVAALVTKINVAQ